MNALLSLLYCVTTDVRWLRCSARLRCLPRSPLLLLLLLPAALLLLLLLPLTLQVCRGVNQNRAGTIAVSGSP
jgi:hypothetical protein